MTTAAIILGGAQVWGDHSLETVCPRLLLPVANAPLVHYTVEWLRSAGIQSAVLCANHGTRLLRARLGTASTLSLDLQYYEDRLPRGPAGCARDAATVCPADTYVVVESALLPSFDLAELLAAHGRSRAAATIAVAAPDRGDELESSEYPVGVYVFSSTALERVPGVGYRDIKEGLVPDLHRAGQSIGMFIVSAAPPRVDGLAAYLRAQAWMLDRLARFGTPRPGYVQDGQVHRHSTAQVAAGARLLGQVMVGARARIEEGAIVMGPTTIGDDCVLGAGCAVGRAVLMAGSRVGNGARVEQCLVATGSRVPDRVLVYGTIYLEAGALALAAG
ncbi:MAG: NDP-sugar synthase [Phycisphaerales bacterium]|nr:NDP-sugar synthase [Phycisphaerales bacterium]